MILFHGYSNRVSRGDRSDSRLRTSGRLCGPSSPTACTEQRWSTMSLSERATPAPRSGVGPAHPQRRGARLKMAATISSCPAMSACWSSVFDLASMDRLSRSPSDLSLALSLSGTSPVGGVGPCSMGELPLRLAPPAPIPVTVSSCSGSDSSTGSKPPPGDGGADSSPKAAVSWAGVSVGSRVSRWTLSSISSKDA